MERLGIVENHDLVNQIQKQIIAGHNRQDILDFIEESYPSVDAVLALNKSIVKFSDLNMLDTASKKGFAHAAIQSLYQKMVEVGDFSGALSAIKEYSKLNGLYEAKKMPNRKDDPILAQGIDLTDIIDNK